MSNHELIDEAEVRRMLGKISRATLWRHIKAGKIPAPVRIVARNRWTRREIEAVVERAVQARGAA